MVNALRYGPERSITAQRTRRRHRAASGVGAAPAALVPHQPRRSPERRQVRQAHRVLVMHPHLAPAAPTAPTTSQFDLDLERTGPPAPHLADRDARPQTDDQPQRTRKADSHRDPPESGQQSTSDSGGSLPTRPGPSPSYSTCKREAPGCHRSQTGHKSTSPDPANTTSTKK